MTITSWQGEKLLLDTREPRMMGQQPPWKWLDCSGKGKRIPGDPPRQLDIYFDKVFLIVQMNHTAPRPPTRGPGSVIQRCLVSSTKEYTFPLVKGSAVPGTPPRSAGRGDNRGS